MSIEIDVLPEPKLQFGQFFEHSDTKTGLAEFGPFGKNVAGFHRSEITLGYIGTRETIAGAKEWIDACGLPIESENIKVIGRRAKPQANGLFNEDQAPPSDTRIRRLEKILNRDFVGFNRDSPFETAFQTNSQWDRALPQRELKTILDLPDKEQRILRLVDLFDDEIRILASTTPSPAIIILALTPEMIERADAVRITGNFHLNFRRAIKARAMRWGIPVQILQRRTVLGKGDELQEKATRAWNFCTAQYYKADCIPWRPLALDRDTCFVGISFYVARDGDNGVTMRASVAQAFDHLGQGLVMRGDPFIWDSQTSGTAPHLLTQAARDLLRKTLAEYAKVNGLPPRRVVLHKSSEYWGHEHQTHNEVEGFQEGIADVFPGCEFDLVSLRQTGLRLFREGHYPPLRGTYVSIGDERFLYTMGYVPYLETYPGAYVPMPWQITGHHGGSAPKDLLREVLVLTKMNVNNCAFADGTPITLAFAERVGEIMKHVPADGVLQPKYKFYM